MKRNRSDGEVEEEKREAEESKEERKKCYKSVKKWRGIKYNGEKASLRERWFGDVSLHRTYTLAPTNEWKCSRRVDSSSHIERE